MKQSRLKKTRVLVSLAFFVATSFVFLDFKGLLPDTVTDAILYLQFTPSLLKFIGSAGLAAGGFLLVLLLTVLFGRVYCSSICPLGFLQDVVSRIGKRFGKKKKYKFARPKYRIRYLILAGTALVFAAGSVSMLSWVDPFSIFGRTISVIVRPVYIGLNNFIAGVLYELNIFVLYPETIERTAMAVILFVLGWLVLVIRLSYKHGRLYCNTVCPVGTLLGLVSRWSIFQIKFEKNLCTNCGDCSIVCKAQCIDIKRKEIDFSRCVGCLNCIASCPKNGLYYRLAGSSLSRPDVCPDRQERRKTMKSLAGLVALSGFQRIVLGSKVLAHGAGTIAPLNEKQTVCPPGSVGIEHFTSACTACQLCVSVCPTGVLQPSLLGYGLLEFMQPHMDYEQNYCNYECVRCSEVCPSGAILPVARGNKKLTQIGKVRFVIENCVVHAENTACGSCSEHCPTQAVHMVPYDTGLTIPEVDESLCIGCGACEHACPTRPWRAIYVDGNTVHALARPPEVKSFEDSTVEEFPF